MTLYAAARRAALAGPRFFQSGFLRSHPILTYRGEMQPFPRQQQSWRASGPLAAVVSGIELSNPIMQFTVRQGVFLAGMAGIVGVIYKSYTATRDWYYDFALEPMGEPVTTPVFFPQTHSYALLQNKLERSFIDKTNLLVLKGSHGGGKTVSAGASYANPHVWYQNALPMWQQYFGYGRQKPWLKGWFSVGDDNPALLEQQMLELAKRVDAQTLAKLNENGIVSRSIKQYLNWLPQGLGQLFTPLSIVNNDRQTLVNLRQYLEAHPGWFFVFDEVVTYEQVAPYLPTRGGVVILTTNNLGFPVKCDDVIAFNALSQEEGLAFARSFFSPDQETSEQLETLVETMGFSAQSIAYAAGYVNESKISVAKFLERLDASPLDVLDEDVALMVQHPNLVKTLRLDLKRFPSAAPEQQILNIMALLALAHPVSESLLKDILWEFSGPKIDSALKNLTKYYLIDRQGDNAVRLSPITHRILQAMLRAEVLEAPCEPWQWLYQLKQYCYYQPTYLDKLLKGIVTTVSECDRPSQVILNLPHLDYIHSELMPQASSVRYQKEAFIAFLSARMDAEVTPDYRQYKALRTMAGSRETKSYKDYLHFKKDCLAELLKNQEEHYGCEHVQVASVLVSLGNVHLALGDAAQAKALFEQALLIKKEHYGYEHVQVALTLVHLGNAHHELGDAAEAIAMYEQALPILKNHYGPEHVEVSFTLVYLSNALVDLGNLSDVAQAKALYEQVLPILKNHYGPEHVEVVSTLVHLGRAHYVLGDAVEAKALYEQALPILKNHYGPEHVEVVSTLVHLGRAHYVLGDAVEAKALYEQALPILKNHYGPEHVEVASTLIKLGTIQADLGDTAKAKDLYERALPIVEKHYGRDHIQVALTLVHLGNTHADLGDLGYARDLYERANYILERYYVHGQVAAILVQLWYAYADLRDAQEALPINEKHYGCVHVRIASALMNLGGCYLRFGDAVQAKDLYERALSIKEKYYGRVHVELVFTLVHLGIAHAYLGDAAQAKALYERTLSILEEHIGTSDAFIQFVKAEIEACTTSVKELNSLAPKVFSHKLFSPERDDQGTRSQQAPEEDDHGSTSQQVEKDVPTLKYGP